jgi:hypothetical protein
VQSDLPVQTDPSEFLDDFTLAGLVATPARMLLTNFILVLVKYR